MCDLDDIKEKIRAAMESQGTYTEDLDLCITLCAGCIYGVSNCTKRYFKEAYEVIRERSVPRK